MTTRWQYISLYDSVWYRKLEVWCRSICFTY